MLDWIRNMFSNEGFMPHIHCYLGKPSLVWTMAGMDMLIGISYVVISATLYSLVRRVKLPYHAMFLAFGLFILACGTTHFMEVYNLWVPNYWLSAFFKVLTAAASTFTAYYLLKVFPQILELTEAAKGLAQTKTNVEEFFRKRLSTPPELKSLLTRTLVLPLGLAALLAGLSVIQAAYLERSQRWIEHSEHVLALGRRLELSVVTSETDLRGYWFSGRADLAKSFRENHKLYEVALKQLNELTSDNPIQQENLRSLDQTFRRWSSFANEALGKTPPTHTVENNKRFYERSRKLLSETREKTESFLEAERNLRAERSERLRSISNFFIFVVGLAALIGGGILSIFGRNSLSKISNTYGNALDETNRALSSRDEFLSIASHELKTPITALKLQLQMTRRATNPAANISPDPLKLARMLDNSDLQLNRIVALVDDLLDIVRIGANKLHFKYEELDLSALVRDVMERYKESLASAGCTAAFKTPGPTMIVGDRFRLEQATLNLLSNAAKYGANKPIEVSVEANENRARLVVADHGIGIPKDKQDKVFDRFERIETSDTIGGLGLGLYITREIIHAHQGTITVVSEPGYGSIFTVDLPAVALRSASRTGRTL